MNTQNNRYNNTSDNGFIATIASDISREFSKTGKKTVNFRIAKSVRVSGRNQPSFENAKAWQGTAASVAKKLRKGDLVKFYGYEKREKPYVNRNGKTVKPMHYVITGFRLIKQSARQAQIALAQDGTNALAVVVR